MHVPTGVSRDTVRSLSSFGVSREDIARYLKIHLITLQNEYQDELHEGAIDANARIAKRLFDKADGGDTTAMIFWLKTRARWREVDKYQQHENPQHNLRP